MKRFSIASIASLMFIFFTFGAGAVALEDTEGWTLLGKDVYINMKSIAFTCGSTVSLWVKIVPEEDSDAVLVSAREQLIKKGRDDKALAYLYSGFLTEIDCSKNSHRELITILYDANKNILHSEDHPRASWATTSPESSFYLVQKAVCEKSLPVASQKSEAEEGSL